MPALAVTTRARTRTAVVAAWWLSVSHRLCRGTAREPVGVSSSRPVVFHRPLLPYVQQPSADGECDRVRAIVGPEFADKILDVKIDGGLRDAETIGDLLVA